MKKLNILLIIVSLFIVATGCSSTDTSADETLIKNAVQKNVEYLNNEDLEGYISTLGLSASDINQSKEMLNQLFDLYDLKSTIESIEIQEIKGDTAKVMVTQTTEKIGGDLPFNDNRTKAIHTLKKVDGEWKFTNTELVNQEPLNK